MIAPAPPSAPAPASAPVPASESVPSRNPTRCPVPPAAPRRAVLALGSNLGDRRAHLQAAVHALAGLPGVRMRGVSPVYESAPVGGPPQPDYLNAVLLLDTGLDAPALLAAAQRVEAAQGRVRGDRTQRWGPRTLDVDLIALGGEARDDPRLTLPHPRAHERGFVLAPWHDVDPVGVLPGHGAVADLLAALGTDQALRRRDDLSLALP